MFAAYDLEVLCEVLQPFGKILAAASSGFHAPISGASSLLREFAGFNEADEFGGGDFEEELVLGLNDSPGTTKGTKISVLQTIFFPSLVRCGF